MFLKSGAGTRGTHIVSLVYVQVCIHVPLVSSPDRSGHAWPRLFEGKYTLDIVSVNFLTRYRINDSRLDAEEREGRRSGFRRCNTAQWGNDVGTRFGLPVCLYALA